MKIKRMKVTVGELVEGYSEDNETGRVIGYGGRLDIRPPYQREFIYKSHQRDAVVDTISKGYPLNVMYWAERPDGMYEIIDGQQRTISIAQYVANRFSVGNLFDWRDKRKFQRLQKDQREVIKKYKLQIYRCIGSDSDRLKWFETINIAGEKLTPQEIKNAVYYGPWLEEAKRYFSRQDCPAFNIGASYINGSPIRQEYLERAIKWINQGDVVGYMNRGEEEPDGPDAKKLWEHFENVIEWVKSVFIVYRKEMKGIDWGGLYHNFKDVNLDPDEIEEKVSNLVQKMGELQGANLKGIYPFILTGDETKLNTRAFSSKIKAAAYEKQEKKCAITGKLLPREKMEADHIKPWIEGGPTNLDNCQMICKEEHRKKTAAQMRSYWASSKD